MVISDAPLMDVRVPGSHQTRGPLTTKFKLLNAENV